MSLSSIGPTVMGVHSQKFEGSKLRVLKSCFHLRDYAKRCFENMKLFEERGYAVYEKMTFVHVQLSDHPEETSFNKCLVAGQCRLHFLPENLAKEAVEGKEIEIQFQDFDFKLTFTEKNGLSKAEALRLIASEDNDDIETTPIENEQHFNSIVAGTYIPIKVTRN